MPNHGVSGRQRASQQALDQTRRGSAPLSRVWSVFFFLLWEGGGQTDRPSFEKQIVGNTGSEDEDEDDDDGG